MDWIFYAIIMFISLGIARVLQKHLVSNLNVSDVALSIGFQVQTSLLLFVYAGFQGFELSGYDDKVLQIALMPFLYIFGNVLLFRAFKNAEASVVGLILTTSTIWTIIFAIVFIGESIGTLPLLGIGLILLSILIVNKEGWKKTSNIGKGEIYALLSSFLFGIALGNDFDIIGDKSLYTYVAFSFLLPGVGTGLIFYKELSKLKSFLKVKNFLFLTFLSIFYAVALISTFEAYQAGGKASFISPINQLSVFIIIIFSALFLNERKSLLIKLIAGMVSLFGVILIAQS